MIIGIDNFSSTECVIEYVEPGVVDFIGESDTAQEFLSRFNQLASDRVLAPNYGLLFHRIDIISGKARAERLNFGVVGFGKRESLPPQSYLVHFQAQGWREKKKLYLFDDKVRAEVGGAYLLRRRSFCSNIGQASRISYRLCSGEEPHLQTPPSMGLRMEEERRYPR